MSELAAVHVTVHGRVQGVNFRYFVERQADSLGLTGYARNLPTGREVEVFAEGKKDDLETLLDYLRTGPPRASVENIDVVWREYSGAYKRFGVKF